MAENTCRRLSALFPGGACGEIFEYVFENANDAIYILDNKGNLIALNRKTEERTGFKREDLIGKSFRTLIPAKNLPAAVKGFFDVISGKSIRLELEIKAAQGKTFPVELSSSPLFIKGKIVGIFGIVRDITERVQMQRKLETFNSKLETILETAMEGIAIVDTAENLTFVNKAFANMLGYTQNELVGMDVKSLVDEEGARIIRQQTETRRKGKAGRYELFMYRKDGESRIVQVSGAPLWNEDGSYTGTVGIVADVTERKRTEKALLESQQKFKEFFMGNPEATIYVGPDFCVLDVNPRFEELFGYSLEEIKGKHINDMVVPASLTVEAEMLDAKAGKGYVYHETLRRKKDGSPISVFVSAAPIRVGTQLIGYVVIYHDISVRKQMEQALRDSEEKFRAISATAKDAIVMMGSDGRVSYWNPAAEKIFGYKKEEAMDRELYKLIAPKRFHEDFRREFVEFQGAGQGNVVGKTLELTVVNREGKEFPIELSISAFQIKGKWNSVSIVRDVAERKKTEEALKESEEKFRNIFEGANDAIVYGDFTGRVLGINRKAEEVAGVKRDEIVGKLFWKLGLVGLKDAPMLLSRLKSRMMDKPTAGFELVIKSKDGRKKFLEVTVSTMRKHGLPAGFLAIIRDITERKQMMTKLEEYSQRLELLVEKRTAQLEEAQEQLIKAERLAAIGQVAAMVGHDLRNPLTGIAGAAYYLKSKLSLKMDAKSAEMLTLIEKDIEHSNKIINDLLEYSREIRLELKGTTPKTLVQEALALVKVPDKIQVLDLAQNELLVKVDEEKMKRVFANVIKNAVDAMPEGGELTVKSRRLNGEWEIVFIDSGAGMSKDVLERIWTPFFTTKAKGMGLGLPICKRIVEAHGGSISAVSMTNKGTTFTVKIPIQPQPKKKKEVKMYG